MSSARFLSIPCGHCGSLNDIPAEHFEESEFFSHKENPVIIVCESCKKTDLVEATSIA